MFAISVRGIEAAGGGTMGAVTPVRLVERFLVVAGRHDEGGKRIALTMRGHAWTQ